jgi:acetamidase/formamidase
VVIETRDVSDNQIGPDSDASVIDGLNWDRVYPLAGPIQVEGAMFSCGDAHGCQGDGEVCVTGLEAPMYAALRFTLEKGRSIPAPQYRTAPGPLTPDVDYASFYGTTGVGPDLYAGAQDAVRAMIDHLTSITSLSREDAYLLCSLCVDLKISEIVDAGQYIVSAVLPEAVLTGA